MALRVALGFHFFYEGLWKVNHPVEFAGEAEGYLTGARGPLAPMFYAMVPDLDGRERLSGQIEKIEITVLDAAGKPKKMKVDGLKNEARTKQYEAIRNKFIRRFADLEEDAQRVCDEQLAAAESYLGDEHDKILTHFEALDRFEAAKKTDPRTTFQDGRRWAEMKKLRGEAKVWLTALKEREDAYQTALKALVKDEKGVASLESSDPFAASWNPLFWERLEQIRFAVTWFLTLAGLCLILGVFTQPAAFGSACFMMFVVMSQPSWPGIIPPDPPQLGHAMLINKDFIEAMALFLVASTSVTRWGGLDYFLHHFVIDPVLSKTLFRTRKEG